MIKTITLGLTEYGVAVSLNNLNRSYEIRLSSDIDSTQFIMTLNREDMQRFAYFIHDSMNCSFDEE